MSRTSGPGRTLRAIILAFAGTCILFFGGIYAFGALRGLGEGPGYATFSALGLIVSILIIGLGGLMIRGGAKLMKPRHE